MSKRYAFTGTNSFATGQEVARLLVKATGGKANIAVISGNESDQGSMEHNLKMNGFLSTLKALFFKDEPKGAKITPFVNAIKSTLFFNIA